MRLWIEFYEGQAEEHENVYMAGKHEDTGFLRIDIRDSGGNGRREIYYPIDRIRKVTIIHEETSDWPHTEPSQELKDDWVVGDAMERFIKQELGG